MLEHGAEFFAWLQQGASIYVCGDAARMAKDVDAALHHVVAQHGGMDARRRKGLRVSNCTTTAATTATCTTEQATPMALPCTSARWKPTAPTWCA